MTRPTILLYDNPRLATSFLMDLSAAARHWKHIISRIGGYDTADFTLWKPDAKGIDPQFTREQAWEMLMAGLGRKVVATLSDMSCWEGEITRVSMTERGVTRSFSLDAISNIVRVNYLRMGAEILLNGDAETTGGYQTFRSAGPYPIVTRSTAWANSGTWSFYVDNGPCDHAYAGIQLNHAINLSEARSYHLQGTINIVTPGATTTALTVEVVTAAGILATWVSPDTLGIHDFAIDFSTVMGYSDGPAEVRVAGDENQHFYVDSAMFYENGTRTETDEVTDADSIAQYGERRIEFLAGALAENEADDRAQRMLADWKWPRLELQFGVAEDGLTVECSGYVHTLANEYVTSGRYAAVSDHVAALVAQSSLITSGVIESNTRQAWVEQFDAERLWDALQKIVENSYNATAGAGYGGGVYGAGKFYYDTDDVTPRYEWKGGEWLDLGGVPVEPCLMRPGLARDADQPNFPYQGTDPSLIYLDQIEYDRDQDRATVRPRTMKRNAFGAKPPQRDSLAAGMVVGVRKIQPTLR